jgi:hypothetical protein
MGALLHVAKNQQRSGGAASWLMMRGEPRQGLVFEKLYEADPDAFAAILEQELYRAGPNWPNQLPPPETKAVSRRTLAFLLADYLNRPNCCSGCRYGHTYFVGCWSNAETIGSHLKNAEKLAKIDTGFATEVEICRRDLARIKAGSLAWTR